MQRALWPLLNNFSRVAVCGMIADYNNPAPRTGPICVSLLVKRMTVRGFIVTELVAEISQRLAELAQAYHQGKIKYREDVVNGLERRPRRSSVCCKARISASWW